MIQFNLLPDIKIEYLRARRQKHLVLLGSVVAIIACVTVMAILVSIAFGLQRKNIKDLSADIGAASQELEETRDLTKMLTVQNQLRALPKLHDDKPVATRLFDYISQATPTAASISRLNVDFTQTTATLSGSADSLEIINIFTDTLKFATYHTEEHPKDEKPAFSNVVLAAFGRDSKGATYTVTLKFDPAIFNGADDVTLTVPQKVTTRSQTEQPSTLFQGEAGE